MGNEATPKLKVLYLQDYLESDEVLGHFSTRKLIVMLKNTLFRYRHGFTIVGRIEAKVVSMCWDFRAISLISKSWGPSRKFSDISDEPATNMYVSWFCFCNRPHGVFIIVSKKSKKVGAHVTLFQCLV